MTLVKVSAAFLLSIAGMASLHANTINFGGYMWDVRNGGGGPGPNNWSDQNVFLDAIGNLHLRLTNNQGQWNAAELYTEQSLGYGKYSFSVQAPLNSFDKNVVLGMFNYPPPSVGPDGTNEIDIEYATWGGAQANHGNWTVWPANQGPSNTSQAFDAGPNSSDSVQSFDWTSQRVTFAAQAAGSATPYASWSYAPSDYIHAIPQSSLPIHINLWAFQGTPPSDGKDVEVVLTGFKFTPEGNVPEPSSVMLVGVGLLACCVQRRRKKTR